MGNTVYVGNVSFKATEADLEELFGQFGEIDRVAIVKDRETGRSRGFAFVTFISNEDADSALKMNEEEFQGRQLKVNIARERAR